MDPYKQWGNIVWRTYYQAYRTVSAVLMATALTLAAMTSSKTRLQTLTITYILCCLNVTFAVWLTSLVQNCTKWRLALPCSNGFYCITYSETVSNNTLVRPVEPWSCGELTSCIEQSGSAATCNFGPGPTQSDPTSSGRIPATDPTYSVRTDRPSKRTYKLEYSEWCATKMKSIVVLDDEWTRWSQTHGEWRPHSRGCILLERCHFLEQRRRTRKIRKLMRRWKWKQEKYGRWFIWAIITMARRAKTQTSKEFFRDLKAHQIAFAPCFHA